MREILKAVLVCVCLAYLTFGCVSPGRVEFPKTTVFPGATVGPVFAEVVPEEFRADAGAVASLDGFVGFCALVRATGLADLIGFCVEPAEVVGETTVPDHTHTEAE